MVAYNFQKQFADDVREGRKRQTIRANGKRRHARPGEMLQLYTRMRQPGCELLREARCLNATPVRIDFRRGKINGVKLQRNGYSPGLETLDEFARRDGFADWGAMAKWFRANHGDRVFVGTLIQWPAP